MKEKYSLAPTKRFLRLHLKEGTQRKEVRCFTTRHLPSETFPFCSEQPRYFLLPASTVGDASCLCLSIMVMIPAVAWLPGCHPGFQP